MKNIKFVLPMVSALLITTLAGPAFAAEKQSKSMAQLMRDAGFKAESAQWTAHTTRKEGKKTTSYVSKTWISGNKYRMEAKDPNRGKTMIYIDDGKNKFMYMPEDKKAVKITPMLESMYAGFLNSDIIAQHAQQRKGAKTMGKEKIDGKTCKIIAYKSKLDMGDSTVTSDVKEWVWTKEDFPLKSIIKSPKSKMNMGMVTIDVPASETETLIKDLVLNKSINPALFTLPAGTKLEEPGKGRKGRVKPKMPSQGQGGKDGEIPADVKDLMKGLF